MKTNIVTALLLGAASLWASPEGAKVYENYCKACHTLQPPSAMARSQAMKAPPMMMVAHRVRRFVGGDKVRFVAFVTDYIRHPDRSKGVCMPMAYRRFGTMPPIGASMSVKERRSVAEWIYERFKSTGGAWMGHGGMGKGCRMGGMHGPMQERP
ncbi:c-type cytochrome [Hydrogenimonas sp. SS33]|uniref:c-type cytochrome n=1 Tax=Hydrogenimonas leucolamina TaxID=2954236 RepID=UPI00336BE4CC